MKVVFHIGTNKTGSTTLQNSLRKSSHVLQEHGILYPKLNENSHHTHLLFAFARESALRDQFGRRTEEGRIASVERSWNCWNELEKQVQNSGCHTLILSSEYAFDMPKENWIHLIEYLRRFSSYVHLVGFLRSPSQHYISALQQNLKFGHRISDTSRTPRQAKLYKKIRLLPCDDFSIRSFERRNFQYDCLVRDFLSRYAGLQGDDLEGIEVLRSNESLSAEGIKLMREFNVVNFPGRRMPGNRLGKELVSVLTKVEARRPRSQPILQPNFKLSIEASYQEDMCWLRDHAGIVFSDFSYESCPDFNPDKEQVESLEHVIMIDEKRFVDLRSAVLKELLSNVVQGAGEDVSIASVPLNARSDFMTSFARRFGFYANSKSPLIKRLEFRVLLRFLMDVERAANSHPEKMREQAIFSHLYKLLLVAVRNES